MTQPIRKLLASRRLSLWALGALVALAAAAGTTVPTPNLDRALAAQKVLAEKQPSPQVLNDLGNLLQLARREDEARAAYERALAMDAGHVGLVVSGKAHKSFWPKAVGWLEQRSR